MSTLGVGGKVISLSARCRADGVGSKVTVGTMDSCGLSWLGAATTEVFTKGTEEGVGIDVEIWATDDVATGASPMSGVVGGVNVEDGMSAVCVCTSDRADSTVAKGSANIPAMILSSPAIIRRSRNVCDHLARIFSRSDGVKVAAAAKASLTSDFTSCTDDGSGVRPAVSKAVIICT